MGAGWIDPFVIFAASCRPADRRLEVRPAVEAAVSLTVDADRARPLQPVAGEPGMWSTVAPALRPGEHALRIVALQAGETDADQIEIDVGWRDSAPARGRPSDHSASIDEWPAHGPLGTRLGPNANGTKW